MVLVLHYNLLSVISGRDEERRKAMKQGLTLLGGIGLGAGLMYLLDPILGKRRRAQLRDQAVHLWHETEDAARVVARDVSHRSYGCSRRGSRCSPETRLPTRW
jgi:hypothetical protein